MALTVNDPELEARVERKVAEGRYETPEALVAAALEQLFATDDELAAVLAGLPAHDTVSRDEADAKIGRGLADFGRGNFVDGERFMTELRRELDTEAGRL